MVPQGRLLGGQVASVAAVAFHVQVGGRGWLAQVRGRGEVMMIEAKSLTLRGETAVEARRAINEAVNGGCTVWLVIDR